MNKLPRIAFLVSTYKPNINVKAEYLLKQGYDVFCFSLVSYDRRLNPENLRFFVVEANPILKRIKFIKLFANLFAVRRLTKEHKIDILHICWLPHCVNAVFSKAGKNVFALSGSDVLVYPNLSIIGPAIRLLYRAIFLFADMIVQDSVMAQKKVIELGAPPEKTEIIENGIDIETFNLGVEKGMARKKLGLEKHLKLVFSPRNLYSLYNIDIIIDSIKKVRELFPDVVYVFSYVKNDEEERYRKQVMETGVSENVRFVGSLNIKTEMPFYFADADVVVSVPSSDSSPGTVYQALACGAKVVITELLWYHGKFENYKDLVAIPGRSPDALAKAIIQLLNDEIKIDQIGAYNQVRKTVDQNVVNIQLEKLYHRLTYG